MNAHCEWLEKIIAKYSGNLTFPECQALDNHVLSCEGCKQAMRDYERLSVTLLPVKSGEFAPRLPSRLLALKEAVSQVAYRKNQEYLLQEADAIIGESFRAQELSSTPVEIINVVSIPGADENRQEMHLHQKPDGFEVIEGG